ncbi:cyclic nucleotide-binding domain-containing protein [Ferrovibrio sp. MS7]|jgi:CRP-like cAMP-binding protein|uniref:cyclic nucleotide-binding domain-containing protein n=1 Tax=Ferrovibrio plantarum TaxID=3119164 RepID=UPI003136B038
MNQPVKTFQRGEVILREGDVGMDAYLLVDGKVEVFQGNGPDRKLLGYVTRGGVFGEMALIDPAPRMASAVAMEICRCHVVNRPALQRAMEQAPALARYLLQSFIRNIRTAAGKPATLSGVLSDSGNILSERQPHRILTRKSYAAGDTVFHQDSGGTTAYLIQTGEVHLIRTEPGGQPKLIRQLGPGEVFGEMALLHSLPRYATAKAATNATLEVIRADHFNQLMGEAPPILQALTRIYASMIRSQAAK